MSPLCENHNGIHWGHVCAIYSVWLLLYDIDKMYIYMDEIWGFRMRVYSNEQSVFGGGANPCGKTSSGARIGSGNR